MFAFTNEMTRLFEPIVRAWSGLIEALHESRMLAAARFINQRRHLIQDGRCVGHLHRKDKTGSRAQQAGISE